MKKFLLFFLVLIASNRLSAQSESLRIGDVQDSWTTYPGSIDTATFLIIPKGLYAEVQLFLDFSVRCTPFTDPNDSLEVQMFFSLPKEAEVVDLWLWIYGVPERAKIYDRWTAQQIYEGIVLRRADPALLKKNSETGYELRVFPLMVNMPRKVKMTFLIPFNKLTGKNGQIQLPLNILKLSSCPLESIGVAYKTANNMTTPKLVEFPQNIFIPQNDSLLAGNHVHTLIGDISSANALTFSLNKAPSTSYLSRYNYADSTAGIYQLELDLANILGVSQKKKTLFLIDFVSQNSTLSKTQVMQSLKNYIRDGFNDGDSVNFMFSDFYTSSFSTSWLPADSGSLSQIFSALDTSYIKNFSNLPSLLLDGIDFIKTNGSGNIVLISSSTNYKNTADANPIINNTISFMGNPKIPVHSIYVDNKSSLSYYGGTYFRGNEYLLSNLSVLTGGEFQSIKQYSSYSGYTNTTFEAMLKSVISKLSGYFSAVNIYASLQSGFTYSDYDFSSINGFTYFGTPFRQVGKFTGQFPMSVIISAQTPDGNIFNTQMAIDSLGSYTEDTVSENIWAAQKLRQMLSYSQTNSVIYQIIGTSINERVLTKYTAFLAVEPTQDSISDPPPILPVNELKEENTAFKCYPNPAVLILHFKIDLPERSEVIIEMYNINGQKVASTAEVLEAGQNTSEMSVSELPAGIYFYRISVNGEFKFSGKVLINK